MITPGLGLVFWMTLTFAVLMFLLAKYAWKPILNALNERETTIVDALNQAKLAREEVQNLKAENERIIQEAKIEGEKMIEAARHSIAMEKAAAIDDMKKQISSLSVDIAETILKKKLDNKDAQNDLVANLLNDKNLN